MASTEESKETPGGKTAWCALSGQETMSKLACDPTRGLSGEEVARRREKWGPNRLPQKKRTPAVVRFLGQFNDFMIWVLLAAVVISAAFLREYIDAGVIMAIVLLNAILGFVQEERAESAMEMLKELGAPEARVLRDGVEKIIPAAELVPGDVVQLEAGDRVPADCRLLTSFSLKANESALTGESVPVEKRSEPPFPPETQIGDRRNMVFLGTHIEYGRAKAAVVGTGAHTEMGHIAKLMEEEKEVTTPLQVELRDVGKKIVYICLFACAVVFVLGVLKGNEWEVMLLFAVSLAVAAIPEGLPAVVTVSLAVGVQRMAREKAIIRNLPAVETLGCATFICSDKTGTLTENRMRVSRILFPDGSEYAWERTGMKKSPGEELEKNFELICVAAVLNNDVSHGEGGALLGDPTEVAILEAGESSGYVKDALEARWGRVSEIPFDSERKMMTTVHRKNGGDDFLVFCKGATEAILGRCDRVMLEGKAIPLSSYTRDRILSLTNGLGEKGLRTLSFAFDSRTGELPPAPTNIEEGLIFLGSLAMEDPPRPEVRDALETCTDAQVKVSMITGDHKATAMAIGKELGLLEPGKRLLEGKDLDTIDDEELAAEVEDIAVYARVSPRHKVQIVKALKERDHVVAMTGDGVNDAPALKSADIGVAMGITGTDVSKEASDMVLADDNFSTIVSAIREGRIIFTNLKKFIYFLLSCNISEVLTMFIVMLTGFPIPLLPTQILWINLVTDGLPALALGMEPPEKDIMEKPPRKQGENILAGRKLARLLWQGLVITAGALTAFFLSHYLLGISLSGADLDRIRTIVFTTMVFTQVLHSYNWRFEHRSFFDSAPWENRYLFGAFLISLALQMAVIYVPFLQTAFHTVGPSLSEWGLILACSIVPVLVIDLLKRVGARRILALGGSIC